MKEIKGNYATAKIFTENLENYALSQIKMICDDRISENSSVRVMPDVHPGAVGPIGLTMTIHDRIIPHLLGIDVGCGISCAVLKEKRLEFGKLDKLIKEKIPSGFAIRKKPHHLAEDFPLELLLCYEHIHVDKALHSLGTLGGGNHFIEMDKAQDGTLYLTVHSGSRHLGKEVTEHYIKKAAALLKAQSMEVPYPMTFLEGDLMEQYIHDIHILQDYAALNRNIILQEILKGMKLKATEEFSSVHNYLEEENGQKILRKGAISAKKDEKVLIPVNMRDGILLGMGKGNKDWNFSAPHGSGRLIRRDQVKSRYTVSAFRKEMEGIYCSCIGPDTLDEAPFAYRSIDMILEQIKDTVEVTKLLKPVYNFKAGSRK